jgi:hypothetical protein
LIANAREYSPSAVTVTALLEMEKMRREMRGDPEYMRIWWKERLRAARRVFNDPEQVDKIVELLEGAAPD